MLAAQEIKKQLFVKPKDLLEATKILSQRNFMILSGGTDIYPSHVGRSLPDSILDLSAVAELQDISQSNLETRIGGAVTWTALANANLPSAFRALQTAALQIGSVQVQNRGTIAGNLCNASPAADGVPPLLVLDAEVELISLSGLRRIPIASFIQGYRKTQIRADEILSAIIIPKTRNGESSAFVKLGARKYLVISIVMAAVLLRKDSSGRVVEARVAVGSASEKALRLVAVERAMLGADKDQRLSTLLHQDQLSILTPIDDVRGTAKYRGDVAITLVGEALDQAAGLLA